MITRGPLQGGTKPVKATSAEQAVRQARAAGDDIPEGLTARWAFFKDRGDRIVLAAPRPSRIGGRIDLRGKTLKGVRISDPRSPIDLAGATVIECAIQGSVANWSFEDATLTRTNLTGLRDLKAAMWAGATVRNCLGIASGELQALLGRKEHA